MTEHCYVLNLNEYNDVQQNYDFLKDFVLYYFTFHIFSGIGKETVLDGISG